MMPDIVLVSGGFFWMGSGSGFENEMPRHRVWLDSFGVAKFPVTHREFEVYLKETHSPSDFSDPLFSDFDLPAVGISWNQAVDYCAWLSSQTGMRFRLPTEAERERAARGSLEDCLYPWGNESPSERCFAGYDTTTGGPEKVGVNPPNTLGLYNMSEGVHEWCSDYYDPLYYRGSPERNPLGPRTGERRVSRGGSWRHRVKFSRCAARSSLPPTFKYADYGFRVALSP